MTSTDLTENSTEWNYKYFLTFSPGRDIFGEKYILDYERHFITLFIHQKNVD